jgi:hypothetical protein
MGKGVKFIFRGNSHQDPYVVYNNIQKNMQELASAEERQQYIEKYINKITSEDLKIHNLSEIDVKDIKEALKEVY